MTVSPLPPLEKYIALDCEMVGTRSGHALAKIGMVDHRGEIILESFVFVHPDNVTDWRSSSSGIKPGDLLGAPTFETVRAKVQALLQDKILVGHAVFNDLATLQHRHPYEDVRDTALYYPLRKMLAIEREGEYPALKKLSVKVLGKDIQQGAHDPVEDARATMSIFMTVREAYEQGLAKNQDVIAGVPRSAAQWYW